MVGKYSAFTRHPPPRSSTGNNHSPTAHRASPSNLPIMPLVNLSHIAICLSRFVFAPYLRFRCVDDTFISSDALKRLYGAVRGLKR